MIDDFTGVWIPPRDTFPFATIFCEKLSEGSKSSVSSRLQCSFINPWQESINTFTVYGDWITNEGNNRLVAKYNEDGEIELFDRYSNDDIRMHGKWKRASVRDYIGIWEQKSTNSNELIDIHCKHLSEHQLECILPYSKDKQSFTFTIRETSIANNARSSLQGKFNHDGSVSWLMEGKYLMTWKRKSR